MTCQEVDQQLDAFLDGGLADAERVAIDAHIEQCSACRDTLDAMRQLLTESHALPKAIPPSRDLWAEIAPRLASRVQPPHGWRARLRSPAGLAAAAVLLLALGTGLGVTVSRGGRRPADSAFLADRARYTAAAATLAEQLAADPGVLAVTTRGVIAQDLTILDAAIREAETALAADPGNAALERMLLTREQQRMELLERALRASRQES